MRVVGDADAFIDGLADESVHLVVADPPWKLHAGKRVEEGGTYSWNVRGEGVWNGTVNYQVAPPP